MAHVAAPLRHCWPRPLRPLPSLRHSAPLPTRLLSLPIPLLGRFLFFPHFGTRPRHFSAVSFPSRSKPTTACLPRCQRSLVFQAQGLRLRGVSVSEDELEEESLDTEKQKSRNQKKREARMSVKWGMDIAEFSPPQIKRILRVASLDNEVYDALMLVKRLGPDVREGKRRQFQYIGRLLRNAEPELMDALIQASKDHDDSKLQALSKQESWTDEEDEEEEEEEETDSEEILQEHQNCNDTASRWFDGLISRDSSVSSEVYSLHNVEFDRKELGRLVRRVQSIEEKEVPKENVAPSKEKNSLIRFLRKIARQTLLASE